MVRWFGPSWGAPICDEGDEQPRPAPADRCAYCGGSFEPGEGGLWMEHVEETALEQRPWHLLCFLRSCGIGAELPTAAFRRKAHQWFAQELERQEIEDREGWWLLTGGRMREP